MGKLTGREIRHSLDVSNCYNGALIGPAMIVGSYAIFYFIPFGMWCLITPLFAMGIFGYMFSQAAKFPLRYGCQDYNEVTRIMYGKYNKVLTPAIDIYIVCTKIIGLAIIMSITGTFMDYIFGVGYLPGMIICTLIALVLGIMRDKVVRIASTVMTFVMAIGLVILIYLIIRVRGDVLLDMFRNFFVPEGANVALGFWRAFLYAAASSGATLALACVMGPIKKKEQTKWIGIFSLIIGGGISVITSVMYVGFLPEIMNEGTPILYVLDNFVYQIAPWISVIFGAVMLAAIVSSMLPDFYVLMVRSDDIIPNKGILGNKYFKYALCGVISATVVISMSLLGLDVLVSKGLTIMGYVAMPLIMIPVCIYWPLRWRKEDRAKKQAEEAA